MSDLTAADMPFLEQTLDTELEARFPGIWAILKDHRTDDDRRLSALHVLAASARDEDTLRWVSGECRAMGAEGNDVLCRLIHRSDIPLDVLVACARSEYVMVCELACSDERLPEAEIRALARTGGWGKRIGIAKNSATPADVLDDLARDADATVRMCVSLNPHTRPAAITALAADPDPDVRAYATELRGAPESVVLAYTVRRAKESTREAVRGSVARMSDAEREECRLFLGGQS